LIWGLFTPAIFSFVRRYRILPPRRAVNALKALGFGLVVAPLQVTLEAVVNNLIAWRALHHSTEEVLRRLTLVRLSEENSRIWERRISKTNYRSLPSAPPARSNRSLFKHITRRETRNGGCSVFTVANGQSSIANDQCRNANAVMPMQNEGPEQ